MIHGAVLLTAVLVSVVPCGPVRADCQSGIEQLRLIVDKVTNPRLKQLVLADIDRALRDDGEADESECAEALDHASRLLHTIR